MSRFTGTSEQRRLCKLLRQIRIEAGLKQTELAERLDDSQSFVSKYEMGERRLDFLEVSQICKAVGISLEELVRRFEASHEAKSAIPETAKTLLGKRPKH